MALLGLVESPKHGLITALFPRNRYISHVVSIIGVLVRLSADRGNPPDFSAFESRPHPSIA